jgi:hypothetical protein
MSVPMEQIVKERHDDLQDPAKRLDAIKTLANELRRPIDEVKQTFEAEFDRLKASARITDYLVLFACRRTKESLQLEALHIAAQRQD